MAQFDVYRHSGQLLLDCQADSLDGFSSRVVVPLLPVGAVAFEFARLTPRLAVQGEERVMATHLISAIGRSNLGSPITSLAADRYLIQAALDTLTGSY